MDIGNKTSLKVFGTLALVLVFFVWFQYENQPRAPEPNPVEKVVAPPAAATVAPPAIKSYMIYPFDMTMRRSSAGGWPTRLRKRPIFGRALHRRRYHPGCNSSNRRTSESTTNRSTLSSVVRSCVSASALSVRACRVQAPSNWEKDFGSMRKISAFRPNPGSYHK